MKTQVNKNHNPQTQRHAHNYKDKILEPKPKSQPSFFQQLHRDKTQRHSTIIQRQNSNPNFWPTNTKLNPNFLIERERERWVFGHGFRERESWVFGHGFRERERVGFAKESWVFGQGLEIEKVGFSTMNLERESWNFGHGFRERESPPSVSPFN